ncbi:MAG: hypothetical protein ACLU9S_00940 [Oscillospiraceae bacterium]
MKKRMALLLAAVLVLTLMTGCSKKEEKDPSGQSTPSEQTPSNGDTTPNGGTASGWRPGAGPARHQRRSGNRPLSPRQQR